MSFKQPLYDELFGGKKAKQKRAVKKAAKRSDKLERMKIRTERRKNVQDAKVKQAEIKQPVETYPEPLPPIGVPDPKQGATMIEPSTPAGSGATMQGGGGGMFPDMDNNPEATNPESDKPEFQAEPKKNNLMLFLIIGIVIAIFIFKPFKK